MVSGMASSGGIARFVLTLLSLPPLSFGIAGRIGADDSPLWGFADLHTHQFANLGFGGVFFHGESFNSGGPPEQEMERALPPCDFNHFRNFLVTPLGLPVPPFFFEGQPIHGPGSSVDLLGNILDGRPHNKGGHPTYSSWPHYTTHDHQQMYHEWIQRAWQGGLRLMVVHALNNENFCMLSNRRIEYNCLDMPAVNRQLQAAKDCEAWIDRLHGGSGKGWYRIAYSAGEARQIIAQGKLAVVLGIEVDDLFGCLVRGGCSEDFVRSELQRYYDLGVRHLFPIHLSDNVFGGSAVTDDKFNINTLLLSGHPQYVRDCSGSGFEFKLGELSMLAGALLTLFNANPLHLAIRGPISYPTYSRLFPHCNRDGLTPLGESLIRDMIAQGMIIDIDHMSELAALRTLEICEETGYPVVGGHTGFLDTLRPGEKRHENQKTSAIFERVRKAGGLFGVGLIEGTPETLASTPRITHTCGNSSQSWAIAYLYAVAQMRGGAVGVGSDFNGFAGAPVPRFGGPGDGNCTGQIGGVSYPFHTHVEHGEGPLMNRSVVGQRMFDYNVDGFAHIGLYPDFVQDLKSQGLTDDDLAPFFRSAEAYVRLWERIESRSYCRAVQPRASPSILTSGFDDEDEAPIGNGAPDDNFVVAGPPGLGLGELIARVVPDDAFPIGPWLPSTAGSKWIGLSTSASAGPPGVYTFRAEVEVAAGANPALVRLEGGLAADNQVTDVRINGAGTGFRTTNGFSSLTPFPPNFGKGLFRAGLNTVEVLVENAPPGLNPVGLRAEAALRSDEAVDLVLLAGSSPPWPSSLPAGEVLTVADTVLNDATAAGTAFSPELSYYLYPAAGGSPLLLGKRISPSLTPGESSAGTLAAPVPAGTPPGDYTLIVSVEARPPSVEPDVLDNLASRGQVLVLPPPELGFLQDALDDDFPPRNWNGDCLSEDRRLHLGPTADRECWVWAKNPVFPGKMTIEFDAEFLSPGEVPEVGRHGGVAFCGTTATERTDPSFSGYEVDWIDRADDLGLRLVRADAGVLTTVAVGNPNGEKDPPKRWRIEALPDRIRVFGDDTLFIDHIDTTYRGGSIGFWAWAYGEELAIDNVLLEDVPLTAAFSVAPLYVLAGTPASFDGSASLAPLGVGIAKWIWSLGDGGSDGGPAVSHTYAAPGEFPVTLTVVDGLRRTASATQPVHVYRSLATFTDCFDFEEGPPTSWFAASGSWTVDQRKLTVATDPTMTDEAWAWAGASPRPIAGDFVAEIELTADFAPGWPAERGAAPPFAGIAIFASQPAAALAEGPTGYLIGWIVPRRGEDPVLVLSFLGGGRSPLAVSEILTFDDQAYLNRWRIEVTADAIALTVKGHDILRAYDRRFRSGFVGLHARNGGSLIADNIAILPQAPPCQLTLAVELPAVDPPILRLRGNGVPPGRSCPPRGDCGCDEVQIALDGGDLGVYPAGNPFELDLPLPASCSPGTLHSVAARCVSSGVVGPAAAVEFTCPAGAARGHQVPGDCDGDGVVDIADALCLLFYLFVGDRRLPCDDPGLPLGSHTEGSRRVIDFDGDASVTITDPIALIGYLFRAGPPPALGVACTPIPGCPRATTCP